MRKLLYALPLLLAGCASEQALQNHYYILPSDASNSEAQVIAPILVVKTNLAEYLNNQGLVYRTSATQIVHAKHSLWAQGIKQQLTQRVIKDLQIKQATYWPIEANSLIDLKGKKQLVVSLQKFNGVYTGVAEIAGEWLVISGDGRLVDNAPFQLEVPLQEAGYEAMISSLSEGVGKLTSLIAAQLSSEQE